MTCRPPICSRRSIHGVAVCRICRARVMEDTWQGIIVVLVRWKCSRGLPPIGGPHRRGIVLHDIRPVIENSQHVVVVVLVRLLGSMWSRGLRLKLEIRLGLRLQLKLKLGLGERLGLRLKLKLGLEERLGLRLKPNLRLRLGRLRLSLEWPQRICVYCGCGFSTTSGAYAAWTRNMPMFGLAVARQGGRVVGLKVTIMRTAVTLFASVPVGMDFEAGF